MIRNSTHHYGSVSKTLHWTILLLVIGQIYLALTAFGSDNETTEAGLLSIHRPLGITIFTLMLVRFGWRLTNVRPQAQQQMGGASRTLALLTHWLLYALLIAIPLSGWAKAGTESIGVSYFGLFQVPNWTQPDETLAQTLRMLHLYLNTTLLALVPVHIGAALWHHFWRKDNTLKRMLPGTGQVLKT